MGAIRLFLALVVVIDHLRSNIETLSQFNIMPNEDDVLDYAKLGLNAGYAVMFFYMISGFLISLSLDTKYVTGKYATYNFYKSRFIRIFSLYWPLYILSIIAWGRPAFHTSHPFIEQLSSIFLVGSDDFIAFATYPKEYFSLFPAYLHPAWALDAELSFYIIAPFLLRSTKAVIVVFLLSVIARTFLVYHFGFTEAWVYYFFPSTILFFLVGNLTYQLSKTFTLNCKQVYFLIGIAIMLSLTAAKLTFDNRYFYSAFICFAMTLPSIFAWTKNNKFLNYLGKLSFPIYLTHIVVIGLFSSGMIKLTNIFISDHATITYSITAGIITTSILIAVVVMLTIEQPSIALIEYIIGKAERFFMSRIEKTTSSRNSSLALGQQSLGDIAPSSGGRASGK